MPFKQWKIFCASPRCSLFTGFTQGFDFTNKLFITVGIFYLNKNEIYSRLIKYAADNHETFATDATAGDTLMCVVFLFQWFGILYS